MRSPESELEDLERQQLLRRLRVVESLEPARALVDERVCINFASNDYLGLSRHPRVVGALADATRRLGAGSGASRLICGTQPAHVELEECLASLKLRDAALTFSSGFACATGVLPAIVGKQDYVILDKLCHASLIDGARLSGATLRVYPHNNLDRLESHLRWARGKASADARIVVVTESIFSMDGDAAPLDDIVELKDAHGALLLLDEAHAFGVVGPGGLGLTREYELEDRVDLQMGTLSKAVGLSGAYVAGDRAWIDLLINRARSFVYSTAPPPPVAAAALAAVNLLVSHEGEQLRSVLGTLMRRLQAGLGMEPNAPAAILPLVLGDAGVALQVSNDLQEAGLLVPAIRYPTVPRRQARLRFTVTATHVNAEIDQLVDTLVPMMID